MKIEIPKDKSIIVVTGPESSGKTTLVNRLKEEYDLPIVEEYARAYLAAKDDSSKYDYDDLIMIARCQHIQEKDAHNRYPLIICDTDIVTIEIWSQEVFNRSIEMIDPYSDQKFYLLCQPDIPWESDPLRENPDDRDRLYELYKEYLVKHRLGFLEFGKKERKNFLLRPDLLLDK